MHVLAPAKINLHLRVGPRRDDGFHPLMTWMCTIGLFDSLTFEISGAAPREFKLRCDRPELPCGADNLVCKAAAALAARGSEPLGVDCFLKKSIPSGAGLGGGSGDAARTLAALNQLCQLGFSLAELEKLAARIGSDVPFFLHEPSAICRGRGEEIEKVPAPRARWALLILPAIHCPTPRIYQQFDAMQLGQEAALRDIPSRAWTQLAAMELLPLLINDLEAPAFALFPELAALRDRIERTLNRPVRMSGSGSSLFTLFDNDEPCEQARQSLAPEIDARILSVPICPSPDDDLA
ncbi:MAG TPA: 4-(cytidine 5'-diphospho)-2-C-methyl-D-erythritol kinase [Tepidisphaeraceae bacterium]|jgi:4-diphosphocytidyl-2-C-methyl-D-erythritol kinase